MGSVKNIIIKVEENSLKIPLSEKAPVLSSEMKRPFWLKTDADHLADILGDVFQK